MGFRRAGHLIGDELALTPRTAALGKDSDRHRVQLPDADTWAAASMSVPDGSTG
jgi:hypothetical protein